MSDDLKETLKAAMKESVEEAPKRRIPLVAYIGLSGIVVLVALVIVAVSQSSVPVPEKTAVVKIPVPIVQVSVVNEAAQSEELSVDNPQFKEPEIIVKSSASKTEVTVKISKPTPVKAQPKKIVEESKKPEPVLIVQKKVEKATVTTLKDPAPQEVETVTEYHFMVGCKKKVRMQ